MGKVKPSLFLIVICTIILGLTQIPYLIAFSSAPPEAVFTGFLINPLDGNSYLAKMYEGYRGDWLFTLPYTAHVGNGAFLFFFYILSGHIARLLHLPLIFMFHLLRAISSIMLILSLSGLVKVFFKDRWSYRFALIMVCFGSGMGWLVMSSGYVTSDFWVAEAYPFLSALINPHFCLAGALMVWVIKSLIENQISTPRFRFLYIILASFIIGLLAPFGVVIIGIVACTLIFFNGYIARKNRQGLLTSDVKLYLNDLLCILLGGAPILLYELYVVQVDPLLQGWNAQNITMSPPVWDLILSFSPLLILAIIGMLISIRLKKQIWVGVVAWLIFGIIFVYLPWSLQRRFLLGLFIPISLLATLSVQYVRELLLQKKHLFNILLSVLFVFVFTTNILLEMTMLYGIKTRDPLLFLTPNENDALLWIEENTLDYAVIIASPQMGLFIPAHTGRRVMYGHPFETVDADIRKEQVIEFFADFGKGNIQCDYLSENRVHYIFWGPRERSLSTEISGQIDLNIVIPVYENNDVIIYQKTHCNYR